MSDPPIVIVLGEWPPGISPRFEEGMGWDSWGWVHDVEGVITTVEGLCLQDARESAWQHYRYLEASSDRASAQIPDHKNDESPRADARSIEKRIELLEEAILGLCDVMSVATETEHESWVRDCLEPAAREALKMLGHPIGDDDRGPTGA